MINRQAKAWIHVALAALAFLVVTGCEPSAAGSSTSARAAETLSIKMTPNDHVLSQQQSTATLTASRGTSPYSWTRGTPSYGTLSAASGASVTYTASEFGNNSISQTITVKDSAGMTASVTITQNHYKEGDDKSKIFNQ